MICCVNKEELLGMSRVSKDEVVDACQRTLTSIARSRSKMRHNYVRQWLVQATGRWRFFWRWIGFKQPTRRDALYHYFHGNTFPPHFQEIMSYGHQESNCKKLLRIALVSKNSTILVSDEGARLCNLGG